MECIKIKSNPYEKKVEFSTYNSGSQDWEDIKDSNTNSKLREIVSDKFFLPYKAKEILSTVLSEYYMGKEPISVIFSGTSDEYQHLKNVCADDEFKGKIELSRDSEMLENARHILDDTKDIFVNIKPSIEGIVKEDEGILKSLNKVSDALEDVIPICVFGNYSSGKSTFINALIGEEILPSGGDPVTAKIYEIYQSKMSDEAEIMFTYNGKNYSFSFEGDSYRLEEGDECDLVNDIKTSVDEVSQDGMNAMVRAALKILNGFEKKDSATISLGDIIKIIVPFSKEGIIGQSYNNFVIFDTPGSNSISNINHSEVLKKAMENFSNGIPVWVSVYESIDSEDNAELCDDILSIKALDDRFTMIVANKADGSDLGEELDEVRIKEILNYTSVKKMNAGGIFFVSSVMGLGSKKQGNLNDKHYRKIFRSQKEMYDNPEDEDYISLYKYNIMPEQIKNEIVKYSEDSSNVIYANSGLLCIEMEMENFASNYSAYNKCQMVYDFLKEIIEEVDKRMEGKVARKEAVKKSLEGELSKQEKELIDEINADASVLKTKLEKESKDSMKLFIKQKIDYKKTNKEFQEKDEIVRQENVAESEYDELNVMYEDSKAKMWNRFKANGKNLFKGDALKNLKDLTNDIISDLNETYSNRASRDKTKQEVYKETSDYMFNVIVEEYKNNLEEAQRVITQESERYWSEKAEEEREHLIELICGSEKISEEKRNEIKEIILKYESIDFPDDIGSLFVKEKFLRGYIFGIRVFYGNEQLNIEKITSHYNKCIEKNIADMSEKLTEKCEKSFEGWLGDLLLVIETNITDFSPELREKEASIKEVTEEINKLETDKSLINESFETITTMKSWKVIG